jgi:hypothetical protein
METLLSDLKPGDIFIFDGDAFGKVRYSNFVPEGQDDPGVGDRPNAIWLNETPVGGRRFCMCFIDNSAIVQKINL